MLAWIGPGATALSIGLAASLVTHAVLASRASGWRVIAWPNFAELSRAAGASRVFLVSAAEHTGYAIQPLIIGQVFDTFSLGLFARANDLIRQAQRILLDVILPALMPYVVETATSEDRLKALVPEVLAHVTVLALPAAAILYLLAEPFAVVLLGSHWQEIVEIFKALSLLLLALPLTLTIRVFFLACEEDALALRQAALGLVGVIAALTIAAYGSLMNVVYGLVAAYGVQAAWSVRAISRSLRPSGAALLVGFAQSIAVSLGVLVSVRASFDPEAHPIAQIVLCVSLAAVVWLVLLFVLRHPLSVRLRGVFFF